jgi:hypothetical protein
MSSPFSFGQDTFNDNKISVTNEVLKYKDPTNDVFYEYYKVTLKNVSGEAQKFRLIINYDQNGVAKSTESGDEDRVFELSPGESISGDVLQKRKLILFKSFLPGNSGNKATNDNVKIESIEVNYL